MLQNLHFNYCIPREYKDSETGEIRYSLPHSGEKMGVGTIEEIQKLVKLTMIKIACPWLQMFDNGYRVSTANSGYGDWNGATFADIDGKHYFHDKKLTVYLWMTDLLLLTWLLRQVPRMVFSQWMILRDSI